MAVRGDAVTDADERVREPQAAREKGPAGADAQPESDTAAEAGAKASEAATSDDTATPGGTGTPGDTAADSAALRALTSAVTDLNERLRDEHQRSAHRETVIDRLHDENRALRAGESARLLDPVFRDLIRLYDELERTGRSWLLRAEIQPAEVAEAYASLAIEVELILSRQGVDRYAAQVGDPFTRADQRAVAAVPADDAGLDGAIAAVVRSGFRSTERVVRHAEVRVYRHSSPPAVEATEPSQ